MTRHRFLAVHLPTLPTDRLRRLDPSLRNGSLATWTTGGGRRLLAAVDAPGTTLAPGQALADAQATHPDLVLRPAAPAADRAFLEGLALWALRFTPLAAADPPDGLLLDVAGCAAPGEEASLLAAAASGLRRGGIGARAVVADVAEAAAALARAGRGGTVLPPGRSSSEVVALPLSALRLSPACLVGLRRLGLRQVGDALRQPRAPLFRRFGRELLDALDAVTGERPRQVVPVRPPPEFAVAEEHADPIVTRAGIDGATNRLVARLCAELEAAGRGARRLTLRAFRVDGNVQELAVGTGLPSRAPAHLRRLFDPVLERLAPELGFGRLALAAEETNPLAAGQDGMPVGGTKNPGEAALGELFDRLRQRLPVWRLLPDESHWPERAVRAVDAFAAAPRAPNGVAAWPNGERPVRLLARPLPVGVEAEGEGPPVRIRLHGAFHPVVWSDGPDCLEAEWWREPEGRRGRAYWRVALGSGARLWLGRAAESPRWFLHGYLP